MSRIRLASWVPASFEQITANSTSQSITSTGQAARVLFITVETQDVRMRFDSTAPTINTGILIKKDLNPFIYEGYNGAALKFVSLSATDSDVTIAGFKVDK